MIRIGPASYRFVNKDIEFNIGHIEKAILHSKGKVDLLCFGETFLQGFDSLCWNFDVDKDMVVSVDSPIIERIKKLSENHQVDLLLGYVERAGEKLFSSCILVEKGIIKVNYRRISEGWKENSITDYQYCQGSASEEFTYRDVNFKIALCGDMWVCPEKFKTDGIVLWPVFCDYTKDEWMKTAKYEYAKQANLASPNVLLVNSISSEESKSLGGAFHFKDGEIAGELELGHENILIIDI